MRIVVNRIQKRFKGGSSLDAAAAQVPKNSKGNPNGKSGRVKARTSCDHLASLCSDLTHIPTHDTPCNRCHDRKDSWLCLCCKEVFCSRFVNKHMLQHYEQVNHCIILSLSHLSVWCYSCNSNLDTKVIRQLQPIYEAYMLEFDNILQLWPIFEASTLEFGNIMQLRPVYEAVLVLKYGKLPTVPYQTIEDTSVRENRIEGSLSGSYTHLGSTSRFTFFQHIMF